MIARAPRPQPEPEHVDDFKAEVREHYDRLAPARDRWYAHNRFYHAYIEQAVARIVPAGASVLELGCATGNLLDALRPGHGVGIDLSPAMVEVARRNHPGLTFEVDDAEAIAPRGRFAYIVASDLVGELIDITAMLERLHELCDAGTRLIFTFHNPALEGMLRLAQRAGLKMPPARQNWVGPRQLANLLVLSDFRIELEQTGLLVPVALPGVARFANRHLAAIPGLRYLNVVNVMVARPVRPRPRPLPLSCSVVIPCRNEVGNIEDAVARMPVMGTHTEVVFVDGASTDGTCERIEEVRRRYAGTLDIKLIHQVSAPALPGSIGIGHPVSIVSPSSMPKLGKGDAVRKGFDAAGGDVLMILDADLTVPPEDLPRFFNALATGKARFINGSRLVYPMEERAMKFVNYLGNKFFSVVFTWLLGQPVRDTLCGTKALLREDYGRIKAGRAYFGDFDPFGDFDLLFGAARLRLQIVEVPVRYRRRVHGVSKVRVIRHGLLLVRMTLIAFQKLKLARWLGRSG